MTAPPTPASVAAVLLIHRSQDLAPLRLAVASALENGIPAPALIIVDNASGLDATLEREFPGSVVMHAGSNRGFAGGNNLGVRRALGSGAEFILLLNNDATLAPGCLPALLEAMHRHPDAGAIQPLIYRPGEPAALDSAGQQPVAKGGAYDLEEPPPEGGPDVEIFGPCAAVALYRASVLERTGGFDETFFIIHEDTDLSMRMRLEGYRSVLATAAEARHARGVSGAGGHRNPLPRYYAGRNALVLLLRYWPLRYLLFYLPFHLVRYARVLAAAVECRLSIRAVHTMMLHALRERSRYAATGLLPNIHARWLRAGCYRSLFLRPMQKEVP